MWKIIKLKIKHVKYDWINVNEKNKYKKKTKLHEP